MKTTTKSILLVALLSACSSSKGSGPTGPGVPGDETPPDTTTIQPLGAFAEGQSLKYPVRVAIGADGLVVVSDYSANAVVGLRDGAPVFSITNLARPLGVAIAGDRLYVGSEGRQSVEVYDLVARQGVRGATGFAKPNAIALADGLAYVVDSKAGVVRVLDAKLGVILTIGAGQLRYPVSLAVDATRVAVADQGAQRVVLFDRAGTQVATLGGEMGMSGEVRGRFTTISSVALSGDDIYVLDAAHALVQVLAGDGTPRGLMGGAGDCDSCVKLALDIAVTNGGRVVATDPERHRVVTLPTEMR